MQNIENGPMFITVFLTSQRSLSLSPHRKMPVVIIITITRIITVNIWCMSSKILGVLTQISPWILASAFQMRKPRHGYVQPMYTQSGPGVIRKQPDWLLSPALHHEAEWLPQDSWWPVLEVILLHFHLCMYFFLYCLNSS